MQTKYYLSVLLFTLALNVYGQQLDIEDKKEQVSPPNHSNGQKVKPVPTKKHKAGNGKPFLPSEKVSPDIPVSFPADI